MRFLAVVSVVAALAAVVSLILTPERWLLYVIMISCWIAVAAWALVTHRKKRRRERGTEELGDEL